MNAAQDYMLAVPREDQERAGRVRMYPSMRLIDPWDLKPDEVEPEDIAHGLAIINRYTGGCPFPVSVGAHSIRMARWSKPTPEFETSVPRAIALRAWQLCLAHLLHDASEAYGLNDLAGPTKRKHGMEEYRAAHDRQMRVIFGVFGIPFELLEETKVGDDYDFRREVASFYNPSVLFPSERVREQAWRDVEREFLETYRLIKAKIDSLKEG